MKGNQWARLLAYVTGRVKASRGRDVGDGTDEQALRFINEIRKARTTELELVSQLLARW